MEILINRYCMYANQPFRLARFIGKDGKICLCTYSEGKCIIEDNASIKEELYRHKNYRKATYEDLKSLGE